MVYPGFFRIFQFCLASSLRGRAGRRRVFFPYFSRRFFKYQKPRGARQFL